MLSKEDLLNAYEIYLSEKDELFVLMDDIDTGYRFSKETLKWELIEREFSWKVWHKAISGNEALEYVSNWSHDVLDDNNRLNFAIAFATKKHSGQFRKDTTIPYIVHPVEVMQILYSMRADINLMIAGVLHDTVEDTNTTLDEIKEIFGGDVAKLVASNSEDKSKSWDERKQHTIDELAKANQRVKMLIMADKLSNMRSIAYDYKNIGNSLWERFNAPKEKQAWYYDGILDSLCDMQFVPKCENAYWEFTGLFKDVFVKYYLDSENEIIFQACDVGSVFCLKKGNPMWYDALAEISDYIAKNIDGKPRYYKTNPIPDNAELLSRKDAELTEDIWNKLFVYDDCRESRINTMNSCFLIKDADLLKGTNSTFSGWLRGNGFRSWGKKGWSNDIVDWVYVNISTKIYAPGLPGIQIAGAIGKHAISIDEFMQIYDIYSKYEGLDPLRMTNEEQKTWNEYAVNKAVNEACKNEYWKNFYESAPSETCKRYIALKFYYSVTLGNVPNYDELEAESKNAEEKFTKADWQHLYRHCGNNPRKVYYKKKMESATE